MKKVILLPLMILALVVSQTVAILQPNPAQAISGSEFNPGNIMSDAVFFNGGALTAAQIQSFLEARVPACDTNGTQIYSGSTTRAQYAASRGVSTPFTCLRDYRQSTPERLAESGLCSYIPALNDQTAAQIIDTVSRACGVSQKVMLVLLQKEQGLVTDDWPWPIQYRSATGFGCPDTAPCDAQFYGFFNQVYRAARVFKWYALNDGPNYRRNQNNYILYNPNAACGGSTVFIENQATAGLYNYTPYQPNPATLSVGLGAIADASCGAYGNKNFWWYYRLWFGNTHSTTLPGCEEATNTAVACIWELRDITTGRQHLFASVEERDQYVAGGVYVYEGDKFFGNVKIAPKPWNVRVYRLITPNGSNFLTTNEAERNALISAGYEDKGTDFYANPASSSNGGYPVYRLYSASLGTHVWTPNIAEREEYRDLGYTYEGVAFSSLSPIEQHAPPSDGQNHVYRFYIAASKSHFWTTGLWERDQLIKAGYIYEDVAWSSSSGSTTRPVYRLYSPTMKKHLYTTDAYERDVLDASPYWNYEGVSQYMSPTATSKPVYRLYSPITTNHLWTTSASERDKLVSLGTFQYEGVAWYQPN